MDRLRYLQGWIGVVGFTAFGNTVSCFLDFSFLSERIYTEVPDEVLFTAYLVPNYRLPGFANASVKEIALLHPYWNGKPWQPKVNALTGRLFGTWTLLAAILRVYCAFHIRNKPVYNLTLAAFVVAFLHFLTETFIYKSCTIETFGVFTPIIVSGVSVVWMLYGYRYLDPKSFEDRQVTMDDVRLRTKKTR